MKNNLQWQTIQPLLRQPVNSQQSQQYGRLIYCIEIDDQTYWVKRQQQGISSQHEQWFDNEIKHYQSLSTGSSKILVPFEIVYDENSRFNTPTSKHDSSSLILIENAAPLFEVENSVNTQMQTSRQNEFSNVVNLLLQSLDALLLIHEQGLVHADLKREHFRILNGQPKLIDFEQMFHFECHPQVSTHGTPRYMAPELFHGELKSQASDIYALGIIWLEWLNQYSIRKKSYMDWAKWHCQQLKVEIIKPFSDLTPVLQQMLMKNKSQRLNNIYQLKQLLSEFV